MDGAPQEDIVQWRRKQAPVSDFWIIILNIISKVDSVIDVQDIQSNGLLFSEAFLIKLLALSGCWNIWKKKPGVPPGPVHDTFAHLVWS